ncbi:MAG: hypothetical protein JSU98_10940 [Gemmatimonadales bacterium]|nr:MAG: hypothetical protein JSU98_10940 [Gemmatimonadales bacterium]
MRSVRKVALLLCLGACAPGSGIHPPVCLRSVDSAGPDVPDWVILSPMAFDPGLGPSWWPGGGRDEAEDFRVATGEFQVAATQYRSEGGAWLREDDGGVVASVPSDEGSFVLFWRSGQEPTGTVYTLREDGISLLHGIGFAEEVCPSFAVPRRRRGDGW